MKNDEHPVTWEQLWRIAEGLTKLLLAIGGLMLAIIEVIAASTNPDYKWLGAVNLVVFWAFIMWAFWWRG